MLGSHISVQQCSSQCNVITDNTWSWPPVGGQARHHNKTWHRTRHIVHPSPEHGNEITEHKTQHLYIQEPGTGLGVCGVSARSCGAHPWTWHPARLRTVDTCHTRTPEHCTWWICSDVVLVFVYREVVDRCNFVCIGCWLSWLQGLVTHSHNSGAGNKVWSFTITGDNPS